MENRKLYTSTPEYYNRALLLFTQSITNDFAVDLALMTSYTTRIYRENLKRHIVGSYSSRAAVCSEFLDAVTNFDISLAL